MKTKRLTAKAIAEAAGVHESTIRRWANRDLILFNTDLNGARVFPPTAIHTAQRLAGTNFDELHEKTPDG